ncbi:MAG: choice-of-anchor D domain-containing protein, partial [Planctomycetes bacterium]|nr:choice-of-anchor D domain-containing protein [Planctomycetota bacterium]
MRAIWFLLLLTLAASALSAQVPDILYYKFDETSGALARNHADPGQGWTNGALSAPPVWNTTDPIIGPASLDNTGQGRRMNTGYSMSERNGQAFTIELWFRTNSNGYQDFCNDSNTFGVWMYNGTVQVYMNGGIRLQTGAGLNDGQWHYMALTRNGGNTLTLYWGNATGTLNSTTANYNMTFSSNALGVLYWQGTVPATYNGEMDEFRLWGSQRSGAELQADRFTSYNTGDMDVFDSSNLYIKHQGTAAVTNVPAASASSHTFTIQNTRSSGNITFTPVTLSSPTGCSAVVTANPSTVTPGSTTTFTIQITPSQTEWSVDVDINNDRSPNPYQFTFTGMVNTGRPEMLYYRFNEGTGNQTVNDAAPSRGNNPATFSAGPNWFTPAQLGPYAAGSTANLPTGFSCINLPRPEFTLEFWVRRTSNSTNTICGDNSAFRIYHQGQDLHIQAGPTNGDQDIDTGINLGNGTWTHLAFVSDPGNYGLRIYVNGTQQFQQVNYTFPFTNAELYVFSNGGTDQFAGQIDEFRFWAHVRSQSQIAADMNVELIGSLEVQRPAANAIANGGNDPVGNVNVGATQGLTYTLANAAAAGLLLGSPAVIVNSTSNCTVNITSNPSNTLVTAGSSTTAQVEVTPTGTGPFTFQLQFDSNDPDNPSYLVNGSGTGIGVPQIQLERPSGSAIASGGSDNEPGTVAGATTSLFYTIRNTGSATLNITGQGFGSNVNCGVVVNAPGSASLAPGATTTMQVDVTPATAGAFSFVLSVSSNDAGTPTYTVNFSDTAAPGGEIDVERPVSTALADGSTDNLGSGHVAGVGTVLTYRVFNNGSAVLNIGGAATSAPSNCVVNVTGALPASIPTGNFADLEITVTPGAAGNFFFDITITSDDVDEGTYNIHADGTSAPGGEIGVERPVGTPIADGANDGLGSSHVAGVGTVLTYRVFNTGTSDLNISGTVTSAPSNCVANVTGALPSAISAGNFADLEITVTPSASGNFFFDITITSDDVDEGAYNIHALGTSAPGGEINVQRPIATNLPDGSTDNLSGSYIAGITDTLTYRVFNNGTADLTISGNSISGAINCVAGVLTGLPATIASGSFADLQINVTPAANGNFSFDIDIVSDDVDEANYDIHVQGVASPGGEIDIERPVGTPVSDGSNDNLGSSHVAGVGSVLTYRVFNNGSATLNIASTGLTGASNCTPVVTGGLPSTIAAGNFADLEITVTPGASGNFFFDITVTSDDVDEGTYNIHAQGTSAPGGEINVQRPVGTNLPDASTDDIGSSHVAGVASVLTYRVFNTGTADLSVSGASTSNAVNCAAGVTTSLPATITAGTFADMVITVTPSAGGNFHFDIDITSDDVDEANYDILADGNADYRDIEVDQGGTPVPTTTTYPQTGSVVGVQVNLPFNISNGGTADLTLNPPRVSVVSSSGVTINTITPPGGSGVLPGGTNAGFSIDYTPTSTTNWNFVVEVYSDDPVDPTYTFTVEDLAPTFRQIEVDQGGSPISNGGTYSLSGTVVGVAINLPFNIHNAGTADITLTGGPFVAVAPVSGVSINSVGQPGGATVVAGGNSGFGVDFTPTSSANWSYTVSIDSNDPAVPTFSFTVEDTNPTYRDIEVDQGGTPVPTAGTFLQNGSVVGVAANLAFNIANLGTGVLTLNPPRVAVVSSTGVTINTLTPPGGSGVLAPAGNVGFSVDYTPTSTVSWNFVVEVYSDDPVDPTYSFTVQDNGPIYRDIEIDQGGTPVGTGTIFPWNGSIVGVGANLGFNIANIGTADATLQAPLVAVVSSSGVTINSVNLPGSSSVVAGGNVGFSIDFTPTSTVSWNFVVEVYSDDPATPVYTFAVQDNAPIYRDIEIDQGGTPVPDAGTHPQTGSIVGVPVNLPFNIANVGTAGLTLTGAPNVQVAPVSGVTINSVTQPGSSSVAGGGNVGFSISYTPTSATNWSFTVSIDSDDPATPTYNFTVQDNAPVYRDIEVDQGGTPVPDTSSYPQTGSIVGVPVSLPFNIANVGTAGLTLTGAPNVQVTPVSGVTINGVTQPGSSSVAGGGNVGFSIDYTPTSTTNWSFTVSIDSDDPATPAYTFTVQDSAPIYRDIEVDQGGTPVPDTTTYPQTGTTVGVPVNLPFNIANVGTAGLTLTGAPNVQISSASGVTINSVTQPGGSAVAGGGNVGFSIDYTPTSNTNWSFTVSIDSDDPATPTYTFTVQDNAPVYRDIEVDQGGTPVPDTTTYPQTGSVVGVPASLPFNIANAGTTGLTLTGAPNVQVSPVSGVTINGVTQPGSSSVAGGGSVGFSIDYTPTSTGNWSFTVSIDSDDPATPTYSFTVEDTAPTFRLIQLDQGGSPIGNTATYPQTGSVINAAVNLPFNITNGGTADLTLQAPRVSVVASSGVSGISVTPPGGTGVLPNGASVGFSIDYTPTNISGWEFDVEVYSDDPATPTFTFKVQDTAPVYPVIAVDQGGSPTSNGGFVDQTGSIVGVPVNLPFNIANAGTSDLTLTGSPRVQLVSSSGVTVAVNQPGGTGVLGVGGNVGFSVDYTPTSTANWNFVLQVASDDPVIPSWSFTVRDTAPVYRDIEVDQGGTPVPDTTTYLQNGTLV